MIDKNPRVSNSFKDFVRVGVQGSYQHYAAQIFQNFIKDSTGLFEKFLESNRSNPVNDSNYDELFNFTTRGFLSNQRTYGIKTSGITIPLDNSSNNVFASIDPVIPGFDRIRHFIYVDDRITRPKLPSTLFSIALEKFHINEIIAARNPGEENIEFCPYKFCDEIRTELGSINNDGCNSIIPVSYCIPTSEHDIGIKDVTDLVNSQVINVHTVLDKDDLYRTLLLITYSMLTNNELDQIEKGSFTSFFRSLVTVLMQKIGSRNFTANLLQSQILSDLIFNNIYTSSIGSITKFYNNVSRIGVTGYVTNKFRYFLKHSTLSTDKYEWHSINSYQSYRNSLGVISGTRTVDILFNYTISEIMAKRLFVVKNPNDKYESMFDFIISTSLLYIIITASLTIGGTDYLTEVENIAGVPTDVYTEEKKFPSKASQYINSLKAKYTDISDTVLSAISAILYGSFACKYVYDFHKRIKNNQHISNKEADFVRGLMDFSLAIYSNGTDTLTGLLRKVTGDPVYEKDTWRKENPKFEHMTDGEIKNLLNTVDCGVENIICRIMDINPIYTIVKYMYSINGDLLSKVQSDFNNNHPVSGGTPRVSTENDNEYDAENKWGFGTMFSKTTPSIIDAFIAGSTVGGDIKTYCDKLVSDVKFALEGDDITVLPDILKRSLVLDTLRYKNISKENEESIDKSLECVVDCISKFKSVVSTDEISCNSL